MVGLKASLKILIIIIELHSIEPKLPIKKMVCIVNYQIKFPPIAAIPTTIFKIVLIFIITVD